MNMALFLVPMSYSVLCFHENRYCRLNKQIEQICDWLTFSPKISVIYWGSAKHFQKAVLLILSLFQDLQVYSQLAQLQ